MIFYCSNDSISGSNVVVFESNRVVWEVILSCTNGWLMRSMGSAWDGLREGEGGGGESSSLRDQLLQGQSMLLEILHCDLSSSVSSS